MIRSGTRDQRKKMLPGGSGSGDLDDATEALLGLPTVLYPDPTTSAATAGEACSEEVALHLHIDLLIQASITKE